MHPHAISISRLLTFKSHLYFSFFPRRILTTDRATRLRGRNTCSKLAATSRRRGERRKRERRVENRKDFFEKERRERKKKFSPRGKGIKRVFIRVEEFVNSFTNLNLFFFRRFLITSSPLREILEKREASSRARERRERAETCRRKCHQFHRRRRIRDFVEKREKRIGERQNPLREIRVLSRLQASDTNPTQTASLVLTLRHRYDESSIPLPPHFSSSRRRETKRRRKMEGRHRSYPPRRILFLGVGGSRLISLNSRETFRGTGGNNYINGVGRKPPLDTSVDAHPFSWRLALPRGSLSPLLTPAPVSIAKHGTDRNNAPPTG